MKIVVRIALFAMLIAAGSNVFAQHRGGFHGGGFGGGPGGFGGGGGGFGGYRGGGGFGGGYAGRGMGMGRPAASVARSPGVMGHPYAGLHNPYFGNRPMYHGGWYRGDWRGHWAGPYGYRPWGWGWYGGWGPGWGWGLGWGAGWGIGFGGVSVGFGMASPWNWGYFGYYNPYWVAPVGGITYVNYSQPVVVPPTPMPAPAPAPAASSPRAPPPNVPQTPVQTQSLGIFGSAQTLFKQGQYQAALNETNRAVTLVPNDSLMHEFRALCLFALGDYQQAAAAVHAVVSVGPGWNWATVSNLYGNQATYTDQLRALEAYCNTHPDAAAPRFLLAYHYLLAEHNQEAAAVLQDVTRLQPDDQLAVQLLKGLTTPADAAPVAPKRPSQPVDRASILGHWKASRPDGSTFDLELSSDSRFTWKFKQQDRQQQYGGNFTLADNYLILTANDQNALIGQVSMEAGDRLNFRLAGGNPAEPGLTFTR